VNYGAVAGVGHYGAGASIEARISRVRISVYGAVQGVGFRPFVCRLARELGLTGQVSNNSSGALVEVEGAEEAVAEFGLRLERDRPKPCLILAKEMTLLERAGYRSFEIVASEFGEAKTAVVLPILSAISRTMNAVRSGARVTVRHACRMS